MIMGPDGIYGARASGQYMYGHGIATIALGELYGQTQSKAIRPKLERAIKLIIASQNSSRRLALPADGARCGYFRHGAAGGGFARSKKCRDRCPATYHRQCREICEGLSQFQLRRFQLSTRILTRICPDGRRDLFASGMRLVRRPASIERDPSISLPITAVRKNGMCTAASTRPRLNT